MPWSQGGDPPSLRLLAPLRFPAASAKRALAGGGRPSLRLCLSLPLHLLILFLFSCFQPSLCPKKRRSRLSILSLIYGDTASRTTSTRVALGLVAAGVATFRRNVRAVEEPQGGIGRVVRSVATRDLDRSLCEDGIGERPRPRVRGRDY